MADFYRGPSPSERESVKIYGIRPTLEALDAGKDFERVLVRQGLGGDQGRELLHRLRRAGVPVQYVPEQKLNQFTGVEKHQGVVAFVSPIPYRVLEDLVLQVFEEGRNPLFLFAAGVTDVRNLGSIARTAECMGVDALLIPATNAARINADAIKTSAGALFHLPVVRLQHPGPASDYLKNSGFQLVGCSEKGEYKIQEVNLMGPTCLIVGGEEAGIPEAVLQKCDTTARISMRGKVGSLNVAVATGMLLYETQRQRAEG